MICAIVTIIEEDLEKKESVSWIALSEKLVHDIFDISVLLQNEKAFKVAVVWLEATSTGSNFELLRLRLIVWHVLLFVVSGTQRMCYFPFIESSFNERLSLLQSRQSFSTGFFID